MRRRDLFEMGAALAAVGGPLRGEAGSRQAKMKLGTQHAATDDILETMSAFGVTHIAKESPSNLLDAKWSVEGLTRLREHVEGFGLKLEMISLPTNGNIATVGIRNVLLGKSPERDREIEAVCQMIRNTAGAGIPRIKYNFTYLGVLRTEPTAGRGSASYSTFDYEKARETPPFTEAGAVSEDENWERIAYFLERVIPVAEEYRIRMALHPHDPPMPRGKAFRGIHRVLGSVEGLKKFISIRESPYHGLNFCQGTVSEMLERPGDEIYDVIRYFGSRNKIFNVHFRNIKGRLLKFQETFPDDGDVDMIRAMRVYKEVGYDGMIMPDHAPAIPGDERHRQAFAFEIGYIAAVIQLVRQEA
ncbi:MAG: mannonate dehydratase [Acidobacteria bacterium]|nr:mannonate dehydratase [Acidobacteriota bacterium]